MPGDRGGRDVLRDRVKRHELQEDDHRLVGVGVEVLQRLVGGPVEVLLGGVEGGRRREVLFVQVRAADFAEYGECERACQLGLRCFEGHGHVGGSWRLLVEVARVAVRDGFRVDLVALAELVDDALCRSVTTVVTVEAPRVELDVARQIQLERPAVEVVEVDPTAVARLAEARRVVGAAVLSGLHELGCLLAGHDLRTVAGLEEAQASGRRRVEQCRQHVSLGEALDVHLGAHDVAFSCIFGMTCLSQLRERVFIVHTR